MTEPSHPEIDEIDDDDVDPSTLPNVPDESEESPWLKIGRHSAKFVIAAIAIFLIIHFAFPALAGIGRSLEVVKDAEVGWIALSPCSSASSPRSPTSSLQGSRSVVRAARLSAASAGRSRMR